MQIARVGVLTHQLGKHRVSAAGPSMVLNFGNEPSYVRSGFPALHLLLLLAEKPSSRAAFILTHSSRKAHFRGRWGAEVQPRTHIRQEASLAPSKAPGPLL